MAGDCGRQGGALDKPQGSRASCLDLNMALLLTGYDLGQYVERGRLERGLSPGRVREGCAPFLAPPFLPSPQLLPDL